MWGSLNPQFKLVCKAIKLEELFTIMCLVFSDLCSYYSPFVKCFPYTFSVIVDLYIVPSYYSSVIIIKVIITALHTLFPKGASWGMQGLNVVFPPKVLCWNPNPRCDDVLGGEALGRWLSHECSPQKQDECPTGPALFPLWKNTRRGPHQPPNLLAPWF